MRGYVRGGVTLNSGAYWIDLPGARRATIEELQTFLEPFGIRLGDRLSVSCQVYRPSGMDELMKEVGEVIVRANGSVLVCPRRDSTDDEVLALLKAGELACQERPARHRGWERRNRGLVWWWQHTLLLRVDANDPYWSAYRTAEVPAESVDRAIMRHAVGE